MRNRWRQVLQHVAGERQFWKKQQVSAAGVCFLGQLEVLFQVCRHITQLGVNLSKC